MTSLDGFRALAIAAVFCYHLDVTWLPSGHIGVIMFLVLTGYLITSSLLRRISDGFSGIGRFWLSRLGRLWLPMAPMIAFVVLLCVGFDHVLLTKARPDILPALGLFENISYIVRNLSYFDQIGGPSPLTHLWYLGIDAQFSLVWPLLMLLFMAVLPARSTTRRLTLVLAVASAVAMGVLYGPDANVTRVYYGPDTRAFAPLVGAWLAFVAPLGKRPARDLRDLIESQRLVIELAAWVSLVALVLAMVLVQDTSALLYRGGMFVCALLSAVVVAALALPGGALSRLLELPPLVWLGSRSYGIYLWHYPLIQLLHAANNDAPIWKVLVVVAASLAAGELTFRVFEQPLSQHTLVLGIADQLTRGRQSLATPAGISAIVLALVLVGDGIGLLTIPDETLVPEEAIVSTGEAADKAMDLSQAEPKKVFDGDLSVAEAVLHASDEEREAGLYDPVLIGDSVPGDAESYWRAACPDGLLDSYVGRRPDQAVTVLDEYLAQGVVGKIVILQAFSNTPVTNDELEHMISACGPDRIVYLVNVRIPESMQFQINRTLATCAQSHDNVHLIDWCAESNGMDDWLYPDGEHLTPTGQPEYVNLIVRSIADDYASAGGTVTRRSEDKTSATGLSVVEGND